MLELCGIHTYYGESHILDGVFLKAEPASITGLLGRNGAGKTTVINSIIGISHPREGRILYKGHDITGLPPYKIAQEGVGLVPQGRRIFKRLTVYENLKVVTRSSKDLDRILNEVYSYFPVIGERSKAKGGQLSGGEQQMLAIARALLTNPDLLLLDEPSEGLAPMIVEKIGDIIKKLIKKGISILLVEQNVSLALNLTKYIYILSNGRIVYESVPQLLMENTQVMDQYIGVQK